MTKSVKAVVIAAGALLVLGGVLVVLLLTGPKTVPADSGTVSNTTANENNPYIVDKRPDAVLSIKVKNAEGTFVFERQKRIVSETNESGNVTSKDEYYWTSGDLKGVPSNEALVRNFIDGLAALPQKSVVEENAADLDKYGLADPNAVVELAFDDDTSITMYFGIQNPADTSAIYFKTADDDTVRLVNYYAVSGALSDVRQFAKLSVTEAYKTDGTNELDSLIVSRADFEEPVEIRYMFDVAKLAEEDDTLVSTFNAHRFVSPITAEVDATKGKEVCYGVYSLSMKACEYLEQTDENMKKCGLDDPQTVVSFKYGGKEYKLMIGDAIREEISSSVTDSGSSVSTVTGYYAVMKDVPGIYSISKENAPWCTFKVADLISRRPLSPYIYSVDSVEITVPNGTYKFDIDAENKRFFRDGEELLSESFRGLYQTLIGSVGEEMYENEEKGAFLASVTFNYNSKYYDIYGSHSETISYYESDDRKCVVVLNGEPIFRVRRIYVERLADNVDALLNGGTLNLDW